MKLLPALSLVTLGGLAMTSCNLNPNYANNGNSPILFNITSINGGGQLDSDVVSGELATPPLSFICPDLVGVRVENHLKNPNLTNLDFRGDVVVTRYEVQYFRSDGRGVQGVDVPYAISGNVTVQVLSGGNAVIPIEVVRRQAKLEPPLIQLAAGNSGAPVLTVFAQITLHAETTIGQTMTATGRLQIDFSDFGDKLTACAPGAITG
ncbi:MAG TPA: hypothetical protein VN461_22595 [Vicinamibacteria bacterium]|jgi:hypothetical protein|nr:hypothetical protein [Vicinamibacteria bacterium]